MAKKTKCLLGIAGSMLAVCSLYAANYSEPFESTGIGEKPSAWTAGWVTNLTYSYSGIAGRPVSGASAKYLVIEGDATCTPSGGTFAGSPLVDMMVQAALPDDELEVPESGSHIAVAVDSNGVFNVYCKNKSDSPDWYPLSSKVYAEGTWARVSLLFDYAKGRCQVRIDGEPMMTANGYLDATTTDTAKNGAWYKLVAPGTDASTVVSNLKVIGCTAVDDVVIAENSTSYAIAANATTNGVSCAWLDKYGLAWDTSATYGGTMTVAEKYARCFNPLAEDQAFELKSMSTTSEKVVIGLPDTVATEGREVVLDYGADKAFGTDTTSSVPVTGLKSVEIDLPAADGVIYYRLRAKDKTGN